MELCAFEFKLYTLGPEYCVVYVVESVVPIAALFVRFSIPALLQVLAGAILTELSLDRHTFSSIPCQDCYFLSRSAFHASSHRKSRAGGVHTY
jgi:hypothetical protein